VNVLKLIEDVVKTNKTRAWVYDVSSHMFLLLTNKVF
jgi:hypothetical protein